ncbi:MAG: alanine--tRNA ligase [Deltaproteobacteria bacterium]|nr:alanine--tRNA ligase [Deltaproteobacteria bacterium]
MISAKSIRKEFIGFFEEKGHKFVRSSPVVPQDDPTLLFTNAGMNQFKDIFLAKGSRDYTRAVNSQKCIRASGKHNDLEDVGRDNYHHTFFEMLGNWSFGDYFKREAIQWAWELLVEKWGLDGNRMYATVFAGNEKEGVGPDEEAENIWLEITPLPPERVLRFGKKDNFWEMGDTGPCGPCSEMHYDLGEGTCPLGDAGEHECAVNQDGCWRFIELWNLVFIQYNRLPDSSLEPLPSKHVDTGMGLERVVRVLQGKGSNYDSDLFIPVLENIAELSGRQDGPGEVGVAFRVIADHLRSLAFAIADGALPSNEGRGYVLRRMLRRAARFGKVLGMEEPFIHRLVPRLAEVMGEAFPEIVAQQDHIMRVVRAEEESFLQTLDRGLEIFERVVTGQQEKGSDMVPGEDVFRLYDTYGFPVDLTRLMAEERRMKVDMEGFESLMEEQRAKGRAAGSHIADDSAWNVLNKGAHSEFVGYDALQAHTRIMAHRRDAEGRLLLVLERTPFYAESGGQVGDRGVIKGQGAAWDVVDVQKDGDRIVHICTGEKGTEAPEPATGELEALVDEETRNRTTLNHTATHLMQSALRKVLGDHVKQSGSIVHPDYLRFDYTHFERPDEKQLEEVERLVNREIRRNNKLNIFQSGYDEAIASGVVALFGEKYGDRVRVVEAGDFSRELCGGCHVRATGEIGIFRIISESSIAAGVRRIVALTGETAENNLREASRVLGRIREHLNAPVEELVARLEQVLDERRGLEREIKSLKKGSRGDDAESMLKKAAEVAGVMMLAEMIEAESMDDLRNLADALRQKMKSGIALIGSVINGKASLLCAVSEDLVREKVKAGEIINLVAQLAGGRGGGPPHMATAGARETEKLPSALQQAPQVITEYLSQVRR